MAKEAAQEEAEDGTVKITSPLEDADADDDDEDDDVPSAGVLPYLAVACIPCIGMVAVNKTKEIKTLHVNGETALALHTAKSSAHIGFLGVVCCLGGVLAWCSS